MSSTAHCGFTLQERFGDLGDDTDLQNLEKNLHLFYKVYDNIDPSSAVQRKFCSMRSSHLLALNAGSGVHTADSSVDSHITNRLWQGLVSGCCMFCSFQEDIFWTGCYSWK